ncbi:carbon-nitrogen hydrolase family protein [Abyssisolibacter fermentans]|uniref:carbon-nitrogen hydrolase family protein n=1 Tax=Abyssisolibacter fermentans TaxID=1766203 RepID=UPI000829D7E3|nr:nitrilase-related carbon-nitrogen hydrolase [Abyssisolibacter fermentans]
MIKISLAQMCSKYNDVNYNLNKMNEFILQAKRNGSSIICFPELSTCGYSRDNVQVLAESLNSDTINRLKKQSRDNQIIILAGMVENYKHDYYITHAVIYPNGKVQRYHKVHLGRFERKQFKAGDDLPVFEIDINNQQLIFGISICNDSHFPEAMMAVALQGAHIIFCPHASLIDAKKRIDLWQKYMSARAYDNRVYIAAVNMCGHNGEKYFGGGTAIWNPMGDMINYYDKGHEKSTHFEIDILELEKLKNNKASMKNHYYLKDRKTEVYKKYLDR